MVTRTNVNLTNGTSINLLSINTNELKVRMFPVIKGLIQQSGEQQGQIEGLKAENDLLKQQDHQILNRLEVLENN